MESQDGGASIDDDIAETQKLLTVVTRPVVRDRLLQLQHALQQVKAVCLCHVVSESHKLRCICTALVSRRLLGSCPLCTLFEVYSKCVAACVLVLIMMLKLDLCLRQASPQLVLCAPYFIAFGQCLVC